SGGPILNGDGEVVGLTQRGRTSSYASTVVSLDLASFIGGSPGTLCRGVAIEEAATVCGRGSGGNNAEVATWNAPAYVVDTYWSLLQQNDYRDAYPYFSPAEQQPVRGLATWIAGYRDDPLLGVSVNFSTQAITGNVATVQVNALRTFARATGCRDWSGTYRLVRGSYGWLIDYAALNFS